MFYTLDVCGILISPLCIQSWKPKPFACACAITIISFRQGRLDYNTEGLLLLTNDGDLARQMELPSSNIVRTYSVRVYGNVSSWCNATCSTATAVYDSLDISLDGECLFIQRNNSCGWFRCISYTAAVYDISGIKRNMAIVYLCNGTIFCEWVRHYISFLSWCYHMHGRLLQLHVVYWRSKSTAVICTAEFWVTVLPKRI